MRIRKKDYAPHSSSGNKPATDIAPDKSANEDITCVESELGEFKLASHIDSKQTGTLQLKTFFNFLGE